MAVKLLAEHLADDAQFVARFRREAMSAARLCTRTSSRSSTSGSTSASGRHYIVMELIRGQSGAEILREAGVLGVQEALSMVLAGLPRARLRPPQRGRPPRRQAGQPAAGRGRRRQARGLRDRQGGRATSRRSPRSARSSGTAAYLAPEQAAGEEVGPPADLYALGVVTYQFLTGGLPYEAQSLTELALKQMREIPPPLDELNPDDDAVSSRWRSTARSRSTRATATPTPTPSARR